MHARRSSAFDLDAALTRVRGRGQALVLMHDNPDPDAMAAAEAMRVLLEREADLAVTVARGGMVGRPENRAMVNVLGLRHVPVDEVELKAFPVVALVDTQPQTGNNSLPAGHPVDIVVDHHPCRDQARSAPWCDVREDFGASSTIVYGYLLERRIPITTSLATALLHAIKSETRDLGREASVHEREAYMNLVRLADMEQLHAIAEPKVPAAHFAALDRALRAAEVRGPLVAANLGDLSYPDLVAEIADLLLPYEQASWVLCVGRHRDSVYLSLRTDAACAHAGDLIRAIVGESGAAGGHGMIAGGRLYEPARTPEELACVYASLVSALARELRLENAAPTPLVRSDGEPGCVKPR